jgi:hypothetical protein
LTRTWVDRLNSAIHFATRVICLQLLLNVLCYLLRDILAYSNDFLSPLKTGRLLTTQDLLDVLAGFFSLLNVELLQTFVQLIYIWYRLVYNSPAVVFAKFYRQISFLHAMIECADLALVAAELIAANPFELVRMVKPLDSGVAFGAFQPSRALVPRNSLGKCFTVFRRILKHFRRPSEIPQVVGVYTPLAVMRVFFSRAPGSLVHEHVENKAVLLQVQALQVVVEVQAVEQALRHEIVLYTFVLEVQVYFLNRI